MKRLTEGKFLFGLFIGLVATSIIGMILYGSFNPGDEKSQQSKNVEQCISNLHARWTSDRFRDIAITCDVLYGARRGAAIKEDIYN
jgi:hypothetical protein